MVKEWINGEKVGGRETLLAVTEESSERTRHGREERRKGREA